MSIVLSVLVVLLVMKILELHRRVSALEAHDPVHAQRSSPSHVILKPRDSIPLEGARTWIISGEPFRKSA